MLHRVGPRVHLDQALDLIAVPQPSLMFIVSFAIFFHGVIWIAFDKDKQGWHDKVAGTDVVKTT